MTYVSGLNYTTYVSQLATLTVISSNDTNFQTIIPACINYSEQRIYRDADFLATYVTDTSTNVVANQRTFTYPTSQGTFLVVSQISILSPTSTATATTGTRVPLQDASRQFIDIMYPNNATAIGIPTFFAPNDAVSCLLGPVPDQAYNVEVTGTQRPPALSASNSSTFLTQTLPDLFISASMVFMSGYMRNFGAQADNAQMAVSWEDQYNKEFQSAITEEFRKKYQSQAWQDKLPNPVATPARV